MAALSDGSRREKKGKHSIEFLQTDSSTLYDGSLVSLDVTAGTVIPHDDTAGNAFLGLYTGSDSTGSTTRVPVSTERQILVQQTVTGVSAQTDLGAPVYATTDNDMTLTRPADDAVCIGIVIRWYSSTTCDILLFDPIDSFLYSMTQRGKKVLHLGVAELQVGTGDHIAGIPLYGHGKIVDFFGVPDGQGAGASADVAFNLEIGGTNVTGGSLQIELADGQATTKVSATAITAANEFYDGDTLDVECAETTAFTAGRINLYAVIEYLM